MRAHSSPQCAHSAPTACPQCAHSPPTVGPQGLTLAGPTVRIADCLLLSARYWTVSASGTLGRVWWRLSYLGSKFIYRMVWGSKARVGEDGADWTCLFQTRLMSEVKQRINAWTCTTIHLIQCKILSKRGHVVPTGEVKWLRRSIY